MQLSEDPRAVLRQMEISYQNEAAAIAADPRAALRQMEIAYQNQAAAPASKLPRLLLAGAGLFLIYFFMLKGSKS